MIRPRANMQIMRAPELAAAGITDPALVRSYRRCRQLNAAHGKTYFFATLLLPPAKRPAVHALYGFARYADDIVDDLSTDPGHKADRLARLTTHLHNGLIDGESTHPVVHALVDTARRYGIDAQHFDTFLTAMRDDLTITEYRTWDDLMGYMRGSAAIIGIQMVPVLGHAGMPREIVEPYAADLGVAFQLTNFLRDVGEDLTRGRIYLPLDDLRHFGLDPAELRTGVVDGRFRRLLAYEIARCREIYRAAEPGIRLLDPSSRECMRTALRLYRKILREIEESDYRVLDRRAVVPMSGRLAVGLPAWGRSLMSRRPEAGRTREFR